MRGRLLISLLVCAFALTLAGCGGDDGGTIPPDDADDLLALLDAVDKYAGEGNCELAQQNAAELINQVNNLPNDVDAKVQSELTKASDHLRQLAADPDQCTSTGASGIEGLDTTAPETTEPDTTAAEPETTTTTTTTQEETTSQEPPADNQQEPPAGPAGGGQGGNAGSNQGGGGNTTSPPPAGGTPSPSGGLEPPSGGGNG